MLQGKPQFGNSTFVYHLINIFTYWLYIVLRLFTKTPPKNNPKISPVIITGMYRSGTTITARIVNMMGYKAGPENHLLKAKGKRKALNPKGFLENYFFMDLSMFVFYKTNSWGDSPPDKSVLEKLDIRNLNQTEGVRFSLLKIHDDRISNWDKLSALMKAEFSNPQAYVNSSFAERSFIKNPHFAPLFGFFFPVFSDSLFIVVFKHPNTAVQAAKKVSDNSGYALYISYYEQVVENHLKKNKKLIFFSHEELVKNTAFSIKKLAQLLEIEDHNEKRILEEVKGHPTEICDEDAIPEEAMKLYRYMLVNCINKA